MSIEIQKQIKDNATSVSDFFSDLYKWTEEQEKEEKRREIRKTASKVGVSEAQNLLAKSRGSSGSTVPVRNGTGGAKAEPVQGADGTDGSEPTEPIRRDGTAMAQYYSDWDQYDPDAEVDKIEDEAFQQQKAEREARQAEKDRILEEMALKPNGDRSRTSAARPRVKVSVRRSGRKVAPVDLAAPRKDEANRLFGAGRYREAIACYTAALDCLDKYEPPEPSDQAKGENGAGPDHDSPGQEQEAIALKVALLANRALACFKLEDWRECVVDASEALRFEPNHHKATLRRGFALARMKRWGAAAKDLDLAVNLDPGDKKAVAELQMARRMLAEQAKEARAHAKCVICDPTRYPTMPTRKLTVKVRRAGDLLQPEKPETPATVATVEEASKTAQDIAPESSARPAAPRTYVPRSAGLRATQEAVGKSRGGKMSMNFYQFEAHWNRLRGRPNERAALLQKVGTTSLPALFRESLDSDLVSSIAEALAAQLKEGAGPTRFAVEVLEALCRTPNFELSIHCLTAAEKVVLEEVLSELRGEYAQEVEAIETFYRRSPATAVEELDEDDVAEVATAERAGAQVSQIFSLDGCD